jgi:hypothetical protein
VGRRYWPELSGRAAALLSVGPVCTPGFARNAVSAEALSPIPDVF